MIKLYVFHTGGVRVDEAIPLREKSPLAVTGFLRGESKKRILPVSCYRIKHPDGNILIDTGWDTIYADKPPKQLFGMVNKISAPLIEKDGGVDTKLKSIGLLPSDIDHVFISHMDFDHTSGLRLVKNAKKIQTSLEEWDACNKPSLRYVDTWSGICKVGTFSYGNTGIGAFGKSYDVFGDGTIQLVFSPGHSKGHFCVKISNNGKYVVLANDAAYVQKSFESQIIPGFTADKNMAEKSLKWLCECRKDPDCIAVIANHDPEVNEKIIELKEIQS